MQKKQRLFSQHVVIRVCFSARKMHQVMKINRLNLSSQLCQDILIEFSIPSKMLCSLPSQHRIKQKGQQLLFNSSTLSYKQIIQWSGSWTIRSKNWDKTRCKEELLKKNILKYMSSQYFKQSILPLQELTTLPKD